MASFVNTKVLSIGASRNIGYYSSLRILAKGGTVTFLLRSPSCFDSDEAVQSYVRSGKARLVKGDALVKEDVARAWAEAAKGDGEQKVDVLLFTVGGTPSFQLTKGFVITPPNLVTQSLLNTLSTIPSQTNLPKIITISSTGLTKSSHASLPLPLKPLYGYFLQSPHKDKVGAEKVVAHCTGKEWDAQDSDVGADIMGERWEETPGLPNGTLKEIVVVRPAFLVDGDCKAEKVDKKGRSKGKDAYIVKEGEIGGYTVGRKDVAHFLVEGALSDWDTWKGKCVSIAY